MYVAEDVTHRVRVTHGSIIIPADFLKEEMDVMLGVEEIQRITLISDIEAIAGVGATARPSLGPGVYPRSSITQTVYVGLDIHTSKTGRIVLPREVDEGLLDLLSLSEEIEEKTGAKNYDLEMKFMDGTFKQYGVLGEDGKSQHGITQGG